MEYEPCMGSKDCTRDIHEAWHLLVARGCLVFLRDPKPRLLSWEGLALLQGARCLRWWNYWASHVLAPTIPSVSLQSSLLWHPENSRTQIRGFPVVVALGVSELSPECRCLDGWGNLTLKVPVPSVK